MQSVYIMVPANLVFLLALAARGDTLENCAEFSTAGSCVNTAQPVVGSSMIQSMSTVANVELHHRANVLSEKDLAKALCSLKSGKCARFPESLNCTSFSFTKEGSTFVDDYNAAAALAGILNKMEALSFVANAIQETGCFVYKEEVNGKTKKEYDYHGGDACSENCTCVEAAHPKCNPSHTKCKVDCDNHYFGRGYLQLTWHANYDEADKPEWIHGLRDNPSLAATQPWKSAAWYWKCRVQRFSCDAWPRAPVHSESTWVHKFSASTYYINGGLECPYRVTLDKDGNYECIGTSNEQFKGTDADKQHAYCRMYFYKTMYKAVTRQHASLDQCCFGFSDYYYFDKAHHCT